MSIRDVLFGYYGTQCLNTVVELGVAECLEAGPKSIEDLSYATNSNTDKLYRVLRYLSAAGLFYEQEAKVFELNQESRQLIGSTSGNLKEFVRLHANYFYRGAEKIGESMQVGVSSFELNFGEKAGQYFRHDEMAEKIYNDAMKENSELYGRLIAELYEFSSYKCIVDIGGGLGSLLANILKKNRDSAGVNIDIPELQSRSEAYLQASGLSSRCQYISGDFYTSIPPAGDVYLMKAILHGKTDDAALLLLTNCKQVLKGDAKLLIIEHIVSTDSERYLEACANDINMLNVTAGKVRTLQGESTLT